MKNDGETGMTIYVKVTLMDGDKPQASFINPINEIDLPALFGVEGGCDIVDDKEVYRIETMPGMTDEEYKTLPEFTGF